MTTNKEGAMLAMAELPLAFDTPPRVEALRLPGFRHALRAGDEFSVQPKGPGTRRARFRFKYAVSTPKGWEVTGWDGRTLRTFRPEHIVAVHAPGQRKVSNGVSAPPPARRRVR